MKTTKHTPGPWDIGYGNQSNNYGVFTKRMLDYGYEESPVCLISPIEQLTDRDQANAKLIAAAPELLEALKLARMSLKELSRDAYEHTSVAVIIESAIKKATE